MSLRNFEIFIILILLNLYKTDNCTFYDKVMDCAKFNFTDCPELNSTVNTLILDFNDLTTLNTPNCSKWNHVSNLSVMFNKLISTVDLTEFRSLSNLYLSHNSIKYLYLNAPSVETIDISYNYLTNVSLDNLVFLKTLNIGHNNIGEEYLRGVLKSFLISRKLSYVDLSYNHLNKMGVEFNSFEPLQLDFLNLEGNNFQEFNFIFFKNNIPGKHCRLDLSNNKIEHIVIGSRHDISGLNLSGNSLSKIDVKIFSKFVGLKQLDLSHNPWNCLCNESLSFINWMKDHTGIVVNKNQTLCKFPSNLPVFDLSCDVSPTTRSWMTSTWPTSTSTWPTTTSIVSRRPNRQAVIGISVAIFILLIIGFFGLLLYKKRVNKRNDYLPINDYNEPNTSLFCDCIPLKPFRRTSQRAPLLINPMDMPDPIDNHHLNIGDTLNVICSSKFTMWIISNITNHLPIKSQVISTRMKQLPYADYTLIFVNGNSCLGNPDFVKNAELAVQAIDKSEIKLLIVDMPNLKASKIKNSLTKFIGNKINTKQHLRCSMTAVCLDDLKRWLNLTMVPHNV